MANTDLTGADGSIAWTSPLVAGTNAPVTTRVVIARGRISRGVYPTTRPGSLMQRVALTEWRGGGVLRVIVTDDATPALPNYSMGTLTLTLKSGQTYAFMVALTSMDMGYNSLTGEPQFQTYEFVLSGSATTETVVKV